MPKAIKTIALFMSFLILTVIFSGCIRVEKVGTGDSSVEVGNAAPDFTCKMADGGTFTLSDTRGKAIILNFWATWCGPCCNELPAFQKLYDEYGDRLQVLAIDYAESKEEVNDFIKENGYTFPFALDEDRSVSALYPTDGIPYTIVIDKNGNIVQTFVGARTAEEQYAIYKAAIEEALNG